MCAGYSRMLLVVEKFQRLFRIVFMHVTSRNTLFFLFNLAILESRLRGWFESRIVNKCVLVCAWYFWKVMEQRSMLYFQELKFRQVHCIRKASSFSWMHKSLVELCCQWHSHRAWGGSLVNYSIDSAKRSDTRYKATKTYTIFHVPETTPNGASQLI